MEVPSEKSKRYDRQLRLWGDRGQSLLESSHVCLINATATGTEILKNLILPGVGAYTIIDSNEVNHSDVGSNFFVCMDDKGKSRSQITMSNLQELNMDVKSKFIDENLESVLSTDVNFFSQFTVVIASDLHESSLLKLSEILWKSSVPLVIANSYGLVGYMRIGLPCHEILETHPENFHDDLRLDCPFPELLEYMDQVNLSTMNPSQRANVPYLVLQYKCLQKWKSIHNGNFPSSYKEKKEFKLLIQSEMGTDADGLPIEEDNVQEAIRNVNQKITLSKIPSDVQDILDDPMCTNISPDSSNFWILAKGVKEFVYNEGNSLLPVRGSIPDMTSSSDMYVQLQRIYQNCANKDVDVVMTYVQQVLSNIGRMRNTITRKDVKEFCRNSAFMKVMRYRSVYEEYTTPKFDELRSCLDDSVNVFYILLRAAERYYSLYQCYPGEKQENFESDIIRMKTVIIDFLSGYGLSTCSVSDDYIVEFCRYGGKEIHSIAAFIGGIASQEVIKLITHQFQPVNNTLLYHAGASKTTTITL